MKLALWQTKYRGKLIVQLMDIGATQPLAVSAAISIRVVTLWFDMLIGLVSLIWVACTKESSPVCADQEMQE